MPKKSRRVAVRQAELGQRKRRLHRAGAQAAAQGPEAQVGVPTVQSAGPIATDSEAPAVPQSAAVPEAPRIAPQSAPAPTSATRAAAPYMWPELRRIGVIAGLMLVILAVLTAVLR